MRFSFTFIATLAAAAIARASGVTKTRQIVDVCATIDAPLSVTILGVPDVLGLLGKYQIIPKGRLYINKLE